MNAQLQNPQEPLTSALTSLISPVLQEVADSLTGMMTPTSGHNANPSGLGVSAGAAASNLKNLRWLREQNYYLVPTGLEMVQEDDGGQTRGFLQAGEQRNNEVLLDSMVAQNEPKYNIVQKESALLSQLAKLHPNNSRTPNGKIHNVFICAHCLPLCVHYEADTPLLVPLPEENDSMIFALYKTRHELAKQYRLYFVGSPKIFSNNLPLTGAQKENLTGLFLEQDCIPVFVEKEIWKKFQSFCYSYLWPITHNFSIFMPQSATHMGQQVKDFAKEDWDAYKKANEKWAETLMRSKKVRSGDIVWAQDWQLLMLGKYVHQHAFIARTRDRTHTAGDNESLASPKAGVSARGSGSPQMESGKLSASRRAGGGQTAPLQVKTGLYVHVPWPSSDLLKCLPVRNDLLRGMLAFDLVGFQIFDYSRHFLTACTRLLGVQHVFKMGGFLTLEHNGKSTQLSSKHLCLPANYGKSNDPGSLTVVVGRPDHLYRASQQNQPESSTASLSDPADIMDYRENDLMAAWGSSYNESGNNNSAFDSMFPDREFAIERQVSGADGQLLQPGERGRQARDKYRRSDTDPEVGVGGLTQPGPPGTKGAVMEHFPNTFRNVMQGGRSSAVTAQQQPQGSHVMSTHYHGTVSSARGSAGTGSAAAGAVPMSPMSPSRLAGTSIVADLPADHKSKIIFGSVDCIERFAGLTNKMQAFRYFLENYPQHHNKFLLVQYCYYPPSVTFDDTPRLEHEVCQCAREINERFGYHIHLQIGQINDTTAFQVLQTANIYIDTCTKNGLNIAAFKFIMIHGQNSAALMQQQTDPHQSSNQNSKEKPAGGSAGGTAVSNERDQYGGGGSGQSSKTNLNNPSGQQRSNYENCAVILSEFSGASRALIGALRVNPWSTPNICQQMDSAMNMLDADRYERFAQDFNYVSSLSLSQWLSDFLTELCFEEQHGSETTAPLPMPARFARSQEQPYQEVLLQSWTSILNPKVVQERYHSCAKEWHRRRHGRLLIFDMDAALVFRGLSYSLMETNYQFTEEFRTALDPIHQGLVRCLQKMCAQKENTVIVCSGRSREQLESFFHKVQGLHIIAEDGYWYAQVEDVNIDLRWACINNNLLIENNQRWQRIAKVLMSTFAKRTQGAFVEESGSCIYWHFGGCEPMFGKQQAQNLVKQLEDYLGQYTGVSIENGNTYVQVGLKGVSKGAALTKFFFSTPIVQPSAESDQASLAKTTSAGSSSRTAAGVDQDAFRISGPRSSVAFDANGNKIPESLKFCFCLCIGNDRSDEDMFKACAEYMKEMRAQTALEGGAEKPSYEKQAPPAHTHFSSKDSTGAAVSPVSRSDVFDEVVSFFARRRRKDSRIVCF
ncbi:unnamed protein product [Amoebophrya sp. A120]|nr:unnamed protein product [Amoebophrya sp. A120]|eukprot:GSA120T00003111001.1